MTEPTPPVAANPAALAAVGTLFQDSGDETPVPRRQVRSWAIWDWATQPFNSVLLTFVFVPLFLVSERFLPASLQDLPDDDPAKDAALAGLSGWWQTAVFLAGLAILLIAPAVGTTADRSGRRKRWLLVYTVLLALLQFALLFVVADPAYFWYGAAVLAVGTLVSEIAGVNYNAMLTQVATPRTIGRVSGLGWGLGYLGGIVALVVIAVLNALGWLGLDISEGLQYRLIAVGCAVWTIVFAIPLFVNVPEPAPTPGAERVGFFASYAALMRDVRQLFRTRRSAFWFLLASAVYRDGLAGVFSFGAILAPLVFGFTTTEVLLFGIAANVVAGLSTILAGRFDDRFGARSVIAVTLAGLIAMALLLVLLAPLGKPVFWACGLILSACVGPAQASSRSLLARVTPEGMQGEIFGLYATTGRAASFLSPALTALFIFVTGQTLFGVLGIAVVLAVGLGLLLAVRLPAARRG